MVGVIQERMIALQTYRHKSHIIGHPLRLCTFFDGFALNAIEHDIQLHKICVGSRKFTMFAVRGSVLNADDSDGRASTDNDVRF